MKVIIWSNCDAHRCEYMEKYGPHFSKAMYEMAASEMYKINASGNKEYMKPMTAEEFWQVMRKHNVQPKSEHMYDALYVMSMAMADFMGSSLPDEKSVAMYVKDYVDDPDAPEGFIFGRFLSDMELAEKCIDWEKML